ncbi:hypothetical protein [Sinomonas albida]|uniref:hypothetical protein n=1 Tax=Sinomonas albida TaxID=369942 RepID=UPI00301B2D92
MPRDILILTNAEPDIAALVHAGNRVNGELRVRTIDDGAVTEVCDDDGNAVLSIGRPEWMQNASEIERLVPSAVGRVGVPVWWIEAWAPWGAPGDPGVAIALDLAAELGGFCVVEDAS